MSDLTIIIGGGLAGVTSFYELVTRGRRCLLLEAHDNVARGTSYANGGGLHPSLPDPWNSPGVGKHLLASLFQPDAAMRLSVGQIPKLMRWGSSFLYNSLPSRHAAITRANFQLAEYSTRRTEALQQFLNLDYGHAAPGTLKLFASAKERDEALRLAELLAADGLIYQALDREALVAREPSLDKAADVDGALYFPHDGIGDARFFCEQLAEIAQSKGGDIRLNTQVQSLLIENGKVSGVRLADDVIRGEVVLCAGVDAPFLVKSIGHHLPIQPAKGYSLTFDAASLPTGLPRHALVDPTTHITVSPLGDKLRILGMAEFIGFDRRIDPKRLALLQGFFKRLFPDLARHIDWAGGRGWAGLRPMSADGRPYIGASDTAGLWFNCGHGHLGWTKAVGSARILADLMSGRAPEIDAAPFSPNAGLRRL